MATATNNDGLLTLTDFNEGLHQFISVSNKINDGWELVQSHMTTYLKKKVVKKVFANVDEQLHNSVEQTENFDDVIDDITLEMELWDINDEDDKAILQEVGDPSCELCTYEYHVVYSVSYSVPVLYVNVYKANGKLLSLQQIWNMVPSYYKDRLQHEKWTFLTQAEHPILGTPFFQLHPCHTHHLMVTVAMVNKQECDYNGKSYEKSKVDIVEKDGNSSLTPTSDVQSKMNFGPISTKSSLLGETKPSSCKGSRGFEYITTWLSSVGPVVQLHLPLKYASLS